MKKNKDECVIHFSLNALFNLHYVLNALFYLSTGTNALFLLGIFE